MSVMRCNRTGCDAVMCDRLILDGTAYICDDCWKLLLAFKAKWPEELTAEEIRDKVDWFMAMPNSMMTITLRGAEIDAEFNRLCGVKDD